jgi:fermentation-respiration switch protein FrsA (DUF1100 family)
MTLRAHGDSTGAINDFGRSASADVLAAVDWLEGRCPGRRIVLWGRSLGASAAAFAAAKLGTRVHGYLLESPFQDLRTAVWNRTSIALPPILDRVAYAGLVTVAPLVLSDIDDISPLNAIAGVPASVPILILAGGADRHALPDEARAIYERVRDHATLVVVERCGHLQMDQFDPVGYRAMVLAFITAGDGHRR